ncbi:MAG: transcriptional regulator [Bdellovibrionales bacterium GWA2_49_15]|nr:MAG: transcriptional regulator [Bdellovibrionales bacterium GWA2_49_15]HAZ13206.1 transcriptional regulator [Bdellovibrionales bacterium]
MVKKIKEEKMLTETELELINILWKMGEGTVAEVMQNLPKERDLAYTSVSTILRILEQKKVLKARKEGRGHVYIPLLSKEEYEGRTLRHVVDHVFDGTPMALAKQFINTVSLSKEELAELKKLIDQAQRQS